MTTSPTPVPTSTSTGAALPLLTFPQQQLLTLNTCEIPLITDTVSPGIHLQVLRLDFDHNEWVAVVTFEPGTHLPLHYHTGPAEVYTLQGRWLYAEYPDQPQTAGSYLYEPGGSVHTLCVPDDNSENTVLYVRVTGANINFHDDGNLHSILDTLTIRDIAESLSAQQELSPPRYIKGADAAISEPALANGSRPA